MKTIYFALHGLLPNITAPSQEILPRRKGEGIGFDLSHFLEKGRFQRKVILVGGDKGRAVEHLTAKGIPRDCLCGSDIEHVSSVQPGAQVVVTKPQIHGVDICSIPL